MSVLAKHLSMMEQLSGVYFKPLDGKSKEEVEAMTIEEITKEENDCME